MRTHSTSISSLSRSVNHVPPSPKPSRSNPIDLDRNEWCSIGDKG